jgi:hypothetical protein
VGGDEAGIVSHRLGQLSGGGRGQDLTLVEPASSRSSRTQADSSETITPSNKSGQEGDSSIHLWVYTSMSSKI